MPINKEELKSLNNLEIGSLQLYSLPGNFLIYQGIYKNKPILIGSKDDANSIYLIDDQKVSPISTTDLNPNSNLVRLNVTKNITTLNELLRKQAASLGINSKLILDTINFIIKAKKVANKNRLLIPDSAQKILIVGNQLVATSFNKSNIDTNNDISLVNLFSSLTPIIYLPIIKELSNLLNKPIDTNDLKNKLAKIDKNNSINFYYNFKKTSHKNKYTYGFFYFLGINITYFNSPKSSSELFDLTSPSNSFLKKGRSSTVFVKSNMGANFVVKRYNIKGISHFLRRFFRPSRAWHSWYSANLLEYFNIATPTPIAFLERRFFKIRGKSYFISNYINAPSILDKFLPYIETNSQPSTKETNAIIYIFNVLIQNQISHGDLKGSNILWYEDEWILIDLDSVKQHKHKRIFKRYYNNDRQRFLKNWEHTNLYQYFNKLIPTI